MLYYMCSELVLSLYFQLVNKLILGVNSLLRIKRQL